MLLQFKKPNLTAAGLNKKIKLQLVYLRRRRSGLHSLSDTFSYKKNSWERVASLQIGQSAVFWCGQVLIVIQAQSCPSSKILSFLWCCFSTARSTLSLLAVVDYTGQFLVISVLQSTPIAPTFFFSSKHIVFLNLPKTLVLWPLQQPMLFPMYVHCMGALQSPQQAPSSTEMLLPPLTSLAELVIRCLRPNGGSGIHAGVLNTLYTKVLRK